VENQSGSEKIIGTIANKANPEQVVTIKYLRHENAFVTAGIQKHMGVKEILVPVHLVAKDFQLIGSIISAILERISQAKETGVAFQYAPRFEVLGKIYSLTEYGEYVKLETV
jgi:hypothetical protein